MKKEKKQKSLHVGEQRSESCWYQITSVFMSQYEYTHAVAETEAEVNIY